MTAITVQVVQEGSLQIVEVQHEGPRGVRGLPGLDADVTAHEAASNPHPQYLTQDEGDARYAVIGVDVATDLSIANHGTTTLDVASSTGTDATLPAATGSLAGLLSAPDKAKLDGIAPGATANATDAALRDRSTHTGTQAAGTITGLAAVATSGAYADLSGRPPLGTAAARDVGTTAGTVAAGDDARLSDARTPTAHNQAWSTITSTPTTLSGYGITDAQPLDADLTSIAALTTTTFGRSLLTQADAPAIRTTLGLATVAATGAYADLSGRPTIPTTAADVLALPLTFAPASITYAATVDLDMAALTGLYRTISLTGNLTFTTSNRAAGRTVTLRLICDGTQRTLTVPAGWVFVGTKPANIAASKTGILSLTFFGTADTDCIAAYGVQS